MSTDSLTLYIDQFRDIGILSREEEIKLHKKVKKGCKKSFSLFVKHNLPLVMKIASYYKNTGMDYLDVIQIGNIAMLDAVKRFDGSLGYKFSTYASPVINHGIAKGIRKYSSTIRVTEPVRRKFAKIARAIDKARMIYKKENVNYKEICSVSEFTEKQLEENYIHYSAYSVLNISDITRDNEQDEQDEDYIECITYDSIDEPDSFLKLLENNKEIQKMLSLVNQRERDILVHRYGLIKEIKLSLKEIGKMYGITNERVRQIQEIALDKIRNKIGENDERHSFKINY